MKVEACFFGKSLQSQYFRKKKMKHYYLDTNIFQLDPHCIGTFAEGGNQVFIPATVFEELARQKTDPGELGGNARRAIKDILKNLELGNASVLNLSMRFHDNIVNDQKIVHEIYDHIFNAELNINSILVTNDVEMQVRALEKGIKCEELRSDRVNPEVVDRKLRVFHYIPCTSELMENEYISFQDDKNERVFRRKGNKAESINSIPTPFGIVPHNAEQVALMDALLDDSVNLVIVIGPAGTGKTLLSLACALEKKRQKNSPYHRIKVSKPVNEMQGQEMGFLPGTIAEKLNPVMASYKDNIEFLLRNSGNKTDIVAGVDKFMESNGIEIEPLAYMRGRSLPNQFFILDECQNISIDQIKTVVTRAGENSKFVLQGDPGQVDAKHMDSLNNGLSRIVDIMKDDPRVAVVNLNTVARSPLAALAVERFKLKGL